jgi:hypothetical protein
MAWLLADWNIRKFTGLAFVTGVALFFLHSRNKNTDAKGGYKAFCICEE